MLNYTLSQSLTVTHQISFQFQCKVRGSSHQLTQQSGSRFLTLPLLENWGVLQVLLSNIFIGSIHICNHLKAENWLICNENFWPSTKIHLNSKSTHKHCKYWEKSDLLNWSKFSYKHNIISKQIKQKKLQAINDPLSIQQILQNPVPNNPPHPRSPIKSHKQIQSNNFFNNQNKNPFAQNTNSTTLTRER